MFLQHEVRGVSSIIQDHVGLPRGAGRAALVDAPPERLLALASPGEYRVPWNGRIMFHSLYKEGTKGTLGPGHIHGTPAFLLDRLPGLRRDSNRCWKRHGTTVVAISVKDSLSAIFKTVVSAWNYI